jgi:hypothetical protein
LSLKDHLKKLFTIIFEDYPSHYEEILRLAGKRRARITDGKEIIIMSFRNKKPRIINDIPKVKIPTGRYSKVFLLELIDGQLCLNEAIKSGLIDCKGKLQEVLTFWRIVEIIIYVSSRSLRAYKLWDEYKRT